MKCPNCKYTGNWDDKKKDIVVGKYGDFYETSESPMGRSNGFWKKQYGCPKCGTVFISITDLK